MCRPGGPPKHPAQIAQPCNRTIVDRLAGLFRGFAPKIAPLGESGKWECFRLYFSPWMFLGRKFLWSSGSKFERGFCPHLRGGKNPFPFSGFPQNSRGSPTPSAAVRRSAQGQARAAVRPSGFRKIRGDHLRRQRRSGARLRGKQGRQSDLRGFRKIRGDHLRRQRRSGARLRGKQGRQSDRSAAGRRWGPPCVTRHAPSASGRYS
jgi:hypothetical protein